MTDEKVESSLAVDPPPMVTYSAQDYFRASFRNFGLFGFLADTILVGDFMVHRLREIIDDNKFETKIDPTTLARKSPGPRTRQLRKYGQELIEAFLVRLVDSFQVYLSDILREVLGKRPEILRSREPTVSLDYLLQFAKMEDLQQDLIDSKVNGLSYKGFDELERWYSKKGIPLEVGSERLEVVELIATRNAIVHNRGRIDARYLKAVPKSAYKVGDMRKLEVEYLLNALSILNNVVSKSDGRIAEKFGLETIPFSKVKNVTVEHDDKV